MQTKRINSAKASSFGARHVQALIMFSLSVIAFGARAFLSVAIVAMTDPNTNTNSEVPTYPEWTDKSIVLSAFFWGYVLPQAFAGWAANRYGPKWFLVVTMAIGSCLGILVPCTAAHLGSKGVMAIRAVQGITQGFVYPSIHYLLSQWAPLSERSRMGTFVMAGGPLGTVISLLITGVLASSKYGWPLVFYFYGVLGLLWCIVMVLCGYNSPVEHPSINSSERSFIESSLGHADGKMRHPTPWKSIFLSTPVWALLIAQSGYSFVFYVLLTQIPSYLNHVMEFDIANNSLLSSLPYFVLWILSFVFSVTSDAAINRKVLSVGASRKLFNGIGMVIPAIALVILGYTSREQTTQAIILMVLSVGFLSATLSGWGVNHIDLSPNHAGTLMGLINAAANCFGIVAPLLAQFVVTDQEDTVQWRIVFLISAASNIAVTVLFTIFGSGEVQPWNMEEHENSKR
ncbi:putative inorganic phosphate cotransporter isoform X2 [Cylas formicarius]|uniref:putative inorganic phosphate cotransporter isoform X2 n=1 Tax=Cylas formicarius TaxID=197179 RepID=UPI002958617F|nr:putative inorganic phosphate cotransporter isoform X2 [Cylas formicarius]